MFDQDSCQNEIYSSCVHDLVDACFDGYNATVLAYGQTGSGKTYTMGTAFDTAVSSIMPGEEGIIPRAIAYLFERIEQTQQQQQHRSDDYDSSPKYSVLVQFMELYNEEINDLFGSLPPQALTAAASYTNASLAFATNPDGSGAYQMTSGGVEQFVFSSATSGKTVKPRIEIHEDHAGGINVQGCSLHEVRSASEVNAKCSRRDHDFDEPSKLLWGESI